MNQDLNDQKDDAYKRMEDIQRKVVDMEASFNQREAELLSSKQSLEEEYRKLEEQNSLSSMQFQKLCEESTRLLSACENEKDLRTKLEAALHIKERQVSSLMEMNARLSADLYVSNLKGPGIPPLRENFSTATEAPRGTSDLEGGMESRMQPSAWQKKEDSPRRFEQAPAQGGGYHAGLSSPFQEFPPRSRDEPSSMLYMGGEKRGANMNISSTLNASAHGEMSMDRKRLMEEIESLISSLQTRSS
ncbi:hypothetical protein GUITHDRAFT_153023 [Guillardia theta CCMP2712]|uniref:Uncharacterized protein n=3 Tax=Guillardia theta TaxID=55529 RepID=L1J8C3_GUITC|nr:hypothetical protein GUITHDRAFT_153023 [Guillardia theta CCMP2712]EKX44310.1 hypothetical protein GUITHDRAFT_153023 [Guillardia theta CCMP2712]|eukprot:XP_005831290.1 hypothetical protein GUITHDRAFT_153023 [Guillardia theta CCMP2712]